MQTVQSILHRDIVFRGVKDRQLFVVSGGNSPLDARMSFKSARSTSSTIAASSVRWARVPVDAVKVFRVMVSVYVSGFFGN